VKLSKVYTRICPSCNKEVTYNYYKSYHSALSRNSICRSCRTTIANKSPNRKCKKEDNPCWRGYKDIPGAFLKSYRRSSRISEKKIIGFTIEDIYNIWILQNKKCKLTGLNIGWGDLDDNKNSASIDRIDSDKGYTLDNIQLVHKDVNLMKNKFDQQYFIDMCKLIVENQKLNLNE
jgi:hypothetical protein